MMSQSIGRFLILSLCLGFMDPVVSQTVSCDSIDRSCNQDSIIARKECLENLRPRLQKCVENAQKATSNLDNTIYEKLKEKIEAANAVLDKRNQDVDADGVIVAKTLAKYQQFFMVISANYQKLMTDFVNTYKPSEATVKSQIEAQYASAESSVRSVLVSAIAQLDSIQRSEANLAYQQRAQAELTTKNAADITERLKSQLIGQTRYIEKNGLGMLLEPFRDLKPSIENVNYYIEKRQKTFDEKIDAARKILQARLATVTKLEIEKEIGPTLQESIYLSSVARFMDEVEVARAKAFKEGPQQDRLKVPFYSTQYKSLRAFLDYDLICGAASKPNWTESGCLRFNQYRAQASRLYNGGLGTYIKQKLDAIQAKFPNVENGKISHIRTLIQNKKYAEAVELYDIILTSDGFR